MLRRPNNVNVSMLNRLALEPIAARLNVSYDQTMFTAPSTDAERAIDALRCGLNLIIAFVYPDGWEYVGVGIGRPRRFAKRAAKYVRAALQTESGAEAISCAAQGYARAMAELWRRAAQTGEDEPRAAALLHSAARSEALGSLLADLVPVGDPHELRASISSSEANRFYDPDNPDALVDLRTYAERARVTSEALALLAGADYEEFAAAIIEPVLNFNTAYGAATLADWTLAGEYWANLLAPSPLPYGKMIDIIASKHAAGTAA